MNSKKIQCPRCLGMLEVTNPKNEPSLLITCPNPQCNAKMRVDFQTGETVLAQADKGDTIIGHLSFAGDKYPLAEGINTIGRKAKSSQATIQIDTDDRSMSRLHAQIKVVRLNTGRIKAILSDRRDEKKMASFPLTIEEEPLFPGDAVNLANGDIIQMGKTKLKYKK